MRAKRNPELKIKAEAADLLRQVIALAEDIIFIVGRNRSVQYCNDRAQESLSFEGPSEKLCCEGVENIYEGLRGSIDAVFQSGKATSIETSLGQPDDETWLYTRLTPILDEPGDVSAVLVVARDISELKRKEKLIERSKMEWLEAIDSMPLLFAVIDGAYRIKKINRALADELGICLRELHGRLCYETFGDKCPPNSCPLRNPALSDKGRSVEMHTNCFGRPFRVNVSALTDDEGQTIGCLYTAMDISEKASASKAKMKNEEHMKQFLKKAVHMIALQSPSGKYLSLWAMPGNIRMPETITGKTPFDFFDSETAAGICDRIRHAVASGDGKAVFSQLKIGEEILHFMDYISLVRDDSGEIKAVMTISTKTVDQSDSADSQISLEASKQLTNREREILKLISSGLTTSQIAEKLFISKKTVATHRSRIMEKLDIHKTSGLVRYAGKWGLF
jgi:DNA-binding CsgD family transcriptional regulator/PAS domain-containing protein